MLSAKEAAKNRELARGLEAILKADRLYGHLLEHERVMMKKELAVLDQEYAIEWIGG